MRVDACIGVSSAGVGRALIRPAPGALGAFFGKLDRLWEEWEWIPGALVNVRRRFCAATVFGAFVEAEWLERWRGPSADVRRKGESLAAGFTNPRP